MSKFKISDNIKNLGTENAFVVKLQAGVPFILADDLSRNRGDVAGTLMGKTHASVWKKIDEK